MPPAQIAGFKAIKTFNSGDDSSAVIADLGDNAAFTTNYRGVAEDDAVALAGRFDLPGMKAAASAK